MPAGTAVASTPVSASLMAWAMSCIDVESACTWTRFPVASSSVRTGGSAGQRLADARPGCRGHGFEGCDGGGELADVAQVPVDAVERAGRLVFRSRQGAELAPRTLAVLAEVDRLADFAVGDIVADADDHGENGLDKPDQSMGVY